MRSKDISQNPTNLTPTSNSEFDTRRQPKTLGVSERRKLLRSKTSRILEFRWLTRYTPCSRSHGNHTCPLYIIHTHTNNLSNCLIHYTLCINSLFIHLLTIYIIQLIHFSTISQTTQYTTALRTPSSNAPIP